MKQEKFRMISAIAKTAPPLQPIYKPYLFKQALSMAIGDPGVCKTTFGYALSMSLSEGSAFLGITPKQPIKVLHLDFESGDSLIKTKYDQMGGGKVFPNLRVYNDVESLYPTLRQELRGLYNEFPFEFMLIDNLGSAFGLRDENDNAEAESYIKTLRADLYVFNCAILIYHHPSKANLKGTRKGSGAFAWARYCDIYLNMNATDEDSNIIEIEIAKHRLSEEIQSKFFQKMGSGYFEECSPPLGYSHKGILYPVDRMCNAILEKHGEHKRADFVAIAEQLGFSSEIAGKALDRLVSDNKIKRSQNYGFYIIP